MLRFNKYSPILDRRFDTRRPIRNERSVEIYFGKVDWYGTNRGKRNAITVEIAWEEDRGAFSAMAEVWNQNGTDCVTCGQCLDEIESRHFNFGEQGNKAWKTIYRLWKLHHLNCMNPGTQEQMDFLANNKAYQESHHDYDVACEELKKAGLYEVPHPDRPNEMYAYGTGWLKREIPEEDKAIIRKLFEK